MCRLSLLTCKAADRYEQHDLLRLFAVEELRAAGEEEAVRERQVAYFLNYAQGHAQDYAALQAEWPNVQGVLEWLEEQQAAGSKEQAARYGQALMGIRDALNVFLDTRGYWREAIRWGDAAAEAARAAGDEGAVARFSGNVGVIHHNLGNYAEARQLYTQSLEIKRKLGDPAGIALTVWGLGNIAMDQGQLEEARQCYEESLATFEKLGDIKNQAGVLHQLGLLAEMDNNWTEAANLFQQSLDILERLRSPDAATARQSLQRVRQKLAGA